MVWIRDEQYFFRAQTQRFQALVLDRVLHPDCQVKLAAFDGTMKAFIPIRQEGQLYFWKLLSEAAQHFRQAVGEDRLGRADAQGAGGNGGLRYGGVRFTQG